MELLATACRCEQTLYSDGPDLETPHLHALLDVLTQAELLARCPTLRPRLGRSAGVVTGLQQVLSRRQR